MVIALALFIAAISGPLDVTPVDEQTEADYVQLREDLRRSTAKWWVVAARDDGLFLVEGEPPKTSESKREAWVQVAFARPQDGGIRNVAKISFDCAARTYARLYQTIFNEAGRPISQGPLPGESKPVVPDTGAEGSWRYVCGNYNSFGWPFPLAREPVVAARVYSALTALGLNGDSAAAIASFDPADDRKQIERIIEHNLPNAKQLRAKKIALATAN
jgi:hypothetical protein